MADDRYYGDQPRFERKDPLDRWAWVFLGITGLALLWFLIIIWLVSTGRLADETLLGRGETFWVGLSTLLVIASVLGLIFVIIGRLGATSGGSYLATDLEHRAQGSGRAPAPPLQPARPKEAAEDLPLPATIPETPQHPARIDDPFGPDGRMLLSYSVPEEQPRGIYGDTWVPIDRDVVLNVKSLLAQSNRGSRP